MLTESRPLVERFAAIKALQRQDEMNLAHHTSEIHRINDIISELDGAILLCQRCLDEQTDMKKFVESLVTAMLQAVFDPHHSFRFDVQFDEGQGKITGLKPVILEGDAVKRQGGGARNVASLAIRIAFHAFLSKRMNLTPFMVLDEQLNNLDADRWPRLVEFLMSAKDVVPQMCLISHQPFECPRTFRYVKSGRTLTYVQQEGETI